MKHAWLYSYLLLALEGKLSQLSVLNRGTLISASAVLPLQEFLLFCFLGLFLTFLFQFLYKLKQCYSATVMITCVNLNRDKHIETLDVTNMHVLGKNKQEEKRKVKHSSILSSSSEALFFLALSVFHFFSVLSRDFVSGFQPLPS